MSLADRVKDVPEKVTTCKTCSWYNDLPKRDKEAFETLAAKEGISSGFLHRMCRDEGLSASVSSFNRHMRDCRSGIS